MKLRFRTLSPIHIGTGEELAPMEYVVYNRQFYRISERQFTDWVDQIMPNDEGLMALSRWISEEYAEMKDIRDNRELSNRNANLNPFQFFKVHQKEKDFVQLLTREPASRVIFDRRTESRVGRSPVVSLGRVRSMVKNARDQPYLPGSSIKGSLRTALFYHYLTNYGDTQLVTKLLDSQQKRRTRKERFGLPLEQEAFYCAAKDVQKNRLNTRDEKMDLMKLVRIPDAHPADDTSLKAQLAKINIYLVETQKATGRDQRGGAKIAVQQPQASYCEIIPVDQLLETDLDFDIDFLLQIKPHLQKNGITSGRNQYWIGLAEKVRQLFGLDLDSLNKQNKAIKQQEVIQHLLKVWKIFSQRQLSRQDEWLDHFAEYDRSGFTTRIENGFDPIKRQSNTTLIHLGYGTGFAGTTALLYFLEDNNLKFLYKQVLEQFKIGNKPGNRGKYNLNLDRFPKSRRFVDDEQSVIRPLGWVQWADDPDIGKTVDSPAAQRENSKQNIEPISPSYYQGKLNYKKPPLLDAVVVKSGRPNKVKVYLSEKQMPVLDLNGYRNPIEEGTVVVVQAIVSKKGKIVQVSFRALKD